MAVVAGRDVKLTPFRFPAPDRERLELFSDVLGVSMNAFVVDAVNEKCDRLAKQKTFQKKLKGV